MNKILIFIVIFFHCLSSSLDFEFSSFVQNACILKNGIIKCAGDIELKSKYQLKKRGVTSFKLGSGTGCAIINDNQLKCWGYPGNKVVLNQPKKNKGYAQVDVSRLHACAVKKGRVNCWGIDFNGFGFTTPPEKLRKVKKVFTTDFNTCAQLKDNSIRCWGADFTGIINPEIKKVKLLALKSTKACAINIQSKLRCWGIDFSEQERKKIIKHFTGFISQYEVNQIAIGNSNICLTSLSGRIKCYGNNDYGNLKIPSDLKRVKKVLIAGPAHLGICAQHLNSFTCWGGRKNWSQKVTRYLNNLHH